jgi:hypothetical protein
MDRVSSTNYQTIGGRRTWRNKNLGAGLAGTTFDQLWFAGVQESLIAPVEGVGIVPADSALGSADTQLLQAIRIIAAGNKTATITANTAVTAANAGLIPIDATAGNITVTLPLSASANGQPFRFKFVRLDATTHTVTINLTGGDTLLVFGGTSVTYGLPSAPLEMVADGGTHWLYTAPLSPVSFPSSLGSSGWKKIPDPTSPSGYLVLQWGSGNSVSLPQAVVLPIAMPTALLRVFPVENHPAGGWANSPPLPSVHAAEAASYSTTGFNMYSLAWSSGAGQWTGPGSLSYGYWALGN